MVDCFQKDLDDPPAIGSTITVKHDGNYANGRLRNPTFWRERKETMEHFSIAANMPQKVMYSHVDTYLVRSMCG